MKGNSMHAVIHLKSTVTHDRTELTVVMDAPFNAIGLLAFADRLRDLSSRLRVLGCNVTIRSISESPRVMDGSPESIKKSQEDLAAFGESILEHALKMED